MNHTPTPWRHQKGNTYFQKLGQLITTELVYSQEGKWIAATIQQNGENYETSDNFRQDAELIVKAVNSYQAMKEALEKLVRYWGKTGPEYAQYDKLEDYIQMAKRALTLANGKDKEP